MPSRLTGYLAGGFQPLSGNPFVEHSEFELSLQVGQLDACWAFTVLMAIAIMPTVPIRARGRNMDFISFESPEQFEIVISSRLGLL
jgi:hypothetical protein